MLTSANSQLVANMAKLVREHPTLDKRLTQALTNLEITDSSNRALLHKLQESWLASPLRVRGPPDEKPTS